MTKLIDETNVCKNEIICFEITNCKRAVLVTHFEGRGLSLVVTYNTAFAVAVPAQAAFLRSKAKVHVKTHTEP